MEVLDILEQKILQLVEDRKKDARKIAELETCNAQLKDENELLKSSSDSIEHTINQHNQERELTKSMISDLINHIDSLVEKDCNQ